MEYYAKMVYITIYIDKWIQTYSVIKYLVCKIIFLVSHHCTAIQLLSLQKLFLSWVFL